MFESSVIVGSKAFKKYDKSVEPKDTDIICTYGFLEALIQTYKNAGTLKSVTNLDDNHVVIFIDSGIVECEISWGEGTSSDLILELCKGVSHAPLNLLYMLKMSHRYKKNSKHFNKTRKDIIKMRELGAEITPDLQELYKMRMKETYTYSHPKLDVSKKDFFEDDGVPYRYDHDSIHKAICIGTIPAYERFKLPNEEVKCCKKLFDALCIRHKIQAVVEESIVLALERSLIPLNYEPDEDRMFEFALQKVCTSITSGWFREFAWEHYDSVVEYYNTLPSYKDEFLLQVKLGNVALHNGGSYE